MENSVLTIDQQLKEMKKYVKFKNSTRMKKYLLNKGYFRMSRFAKYTLSYTDTLKGLPSHDLLISLYEFDKDLRILIFKYIKSIEIKFRTSLVTYMVQETNDPTFYLNEKYYTPSRGQNTRYQKNKSRELYNSYYKDILKKESNLRKNNMKFPELKEYRKRGKYNGQKLPAWTIIEYIDMGTVLTMFKFLNNMHRKNIIRICLDEKRLSKQFAITFDTWMNAIRNIRNKCAHHNRVIGVTVPEITILKDDVNNVTSISSTNLMSRIYALAKVMDISDLAVFKAQLKKIVNRFNKNDFKLHDLDILPKDWELVYDKI
jgi:abortive infection bacteriophage resistance protein